MMNKQQVQEQPTGKKHTFLKRILWVAAVLGLLLSVLPFGIKYGIEKALLIAGSRHVSVEDVDLNLFTGQLVINRLTASVDDQPALEIGSLSVGIDWLPLFKKQIIVNSMSLTGAFLELETLEDKTLKVAGISVPKGDIKEPSNEPSGWGFGLGNVHIVDSRVQIKSPEFSATAKIDDLLLAELFSWKQGEASDFTFDTYINGSHFVGDLDLDIFAQTPSVKGALKVDQFSLNRYQSLVGNSLDELKGNLSADIKFTLSMFETGVEYQQSGIVELSELMVSAQEVRIAQDKLSWDGAIKVDTQRTEMLLSVKGALNLNNVAADSLRNGMRLAQIDALNIKQVSIEQLGNVQVLGLAVEGLVVAKKEEKPLLELAGVTIDFLQLTDLTDVEIDNIVMTDLQSDVQITKAGEVELLNELKDSAQQKIAVEAESVVVDEAMPSATKPLEPLLRIGSIKVVGNSQVDVKSATVSGSIKKEIKLKRVELGKLNNRTPNAFTPITIEATINKHSDFSMTGDIAPFSKKTNAKIKTKLSAFELPEFSPIIRQELGYNIESGQLNADMSLDVKQDIIDGNTKLDINGLVMQAADEEKMAVMAQQLSMPLDSALSLLRDSNDDISLEVPIKGDLAEPDFDIGNIINTALGNALQGTVKSFLKYALQPYGLIFMVAEKAYGVATSISLDAIEFEPGQSSLRKEAEPYIVKIGELMNKRPGLRIRLCGVAVPSDKSVLEQKKAMALKKQASKKTTPAIKTVDATPKAYKDEMLVLAKERALTIKTKLASDYKVDAKRLFNCLPSITEKDEKPRVDVLI